MELEHVLRWLAGGEPKTVGELQRAAEVLGRHARGRLDVAVAKVRVAVQLEALGA